MVVTGGLPYVHVSYRACCCWQGRADNLSGKACPGWGKVTETAVRLRGPLVAAAGHTRRHSRHRRQTDLASPTRGLLHVTDSLHQWPSPWPWPHSQHHCCNWPHYAPIVSDPCQSEANVWQARKWQGPRLSCSWAMWHRIQGWFYRPIDQYGGPLVFIRPLVASLWQQPERALDMERSGGNVR